MSTLKAGDQVRLKASEHRRVGTVVNVSDGMVAVRYEHRPETYTRGYYPADHLELVQALQVEGSKVQVQEPVNVERSTLNAERSKPKATTAQIIGGAK